MEGLTTFLTDIGSFFSQVVTWCGDILDLIISNPLLMVMVAGMAIAGYVISYVTRLIRA